MNSLVVYLSQLNIFNQNELFILETNFIKTTYDLILNIPRKYTDFSLTDLLFAKNNDLVVIKGVFIGPIIETKLKTFNKYNFCLDYEEQKLLVTFIRPKNYYRFKDGDEVLVKGKFNQKKFEIMATDIKYYAHNQNEIVPNYQLEGIHDKKISKAIKHIFENNLVVIIENQIEQFFPSIKVSRWQSYYNLHFPRNYKDIEIANNRFKYEEALALNIKVLTNFKPQHRLPIKYDLNKVKMFIDSLPYILTDEQKNAVNDCFLDFKKNYYGFRLIQGDVGSGKTIVALIAAIGMITAGFQVAFMAPTQILANQHYESIKNLMFNFITPVLLTNNIASKQKVISQIRDGQVNFIIGTHTLASSSTDFQNLGLVIIDEQQKFGVSTRSNLKKKAQHVDVIYLSATPIPQSLSISLFGDMSITNIKCKPPHRAIIHTHYHLISNYQVMFKAMHSELLKGHKILLVVPAITTENKGMNINDLHAIFKSYFSNEIIIIHGDIDNKTNTKNIASLQPGIGKIIIGTSMIEVGIDIKDATIIGIFGAEHFGISQLHQLRGRVGRSAFESHCFLFADSLENERLKMVQKYNDGFKLSEFDLLIRGPGDFVGLKQSGFTNFKFLNFRTDLEILKSCRKSAISIVNKPDFLTNKKYTQIRKLVSLIC